MSTTNRPQKGCVDIARPLAPGRMSPSKGIDETWIAVMPMF
jgi:hypothetical protein